MTGSLGVWLLQPGPRGAERFMSKIIAIDVETTGLNPRKDKLHGCGVATTGTSYYIRDSAVNTDCDHLVGHNLRFDLKFLKLTPDTQIWDTKILAQLLDENQELGLKPLSLKYLGADSLPCKQRLDTAITQQKLKNIADLTQLDIDEGGFTEIISEYCEEDCRNTLQLFFLLGKKLGEMDEKMKAAGYLKTPKDYFIEEAMPLEKVLLAMENRGIRLNLGRLQDYKTRLIAENSTLIEQLLHICSLELAHIDGELHQKELGKRKSDKGKKNVLEVSRFNWKSGDHLGKLVYEQFGVIKRLIKKTRTGKYDTSEKQLKMLAACSENEKLHAMLDRYLKWKKNLKLLTTYTGESKGLLKHVDNGRVYAGYLQVGSGKEGKTGGTVTGRLSSRSPNMQNLPRDSEVKSFFIPDSDEYAFCYFDYSQLELRVAAHLSQDEMLLRAYRENQDLHALTASFLGVDRQLGKKLNFAMIYNASPYRLQAELGESYTIETCQELRKAFFDTYSGYANYLRNQRKFMTTNGVVISATGRIRRLPGLFNNPWKSKEFRHAINQGYNFPIQSLGASITKRAMLVLHNQGFDIVTQVHDSVVIQLHKSELARVKDIQAVAEGIYPLTVPLKADMKLLNSLEEGDKYTGEEDARESSTKRPELKVIG